MYKSKYIHRFACPPGFSNCPPQAEILRTRLLLNCIIFYGTFAKLLFSFSLKWEVRCFLLNIRSGYVSLNDLQNPLPLPSPLAVKVKPMQKKSRFSQKKLSSKIQILSFNSNLFRLEFKLVQIFFFSFLRIFWKV